MLSFRKSISIGNGTRMNFSKRGISMSKRIGPVTVSTGKSVNAFTVIFWLIFWPFALLGLILKIAGKANAK